MRNDCLPIVKITRPPAENVSVQSDHERGEAGFLRAVKHGDGDFFLFVLRPVELKPSDAVTIGFGCFFDVGAGGCAHHVRNVVLGAGASDGEFAVGVEDACEIVRNGSSRDFRSLGTTHAEHKPAQPR